VDTARACHERGVATIAVTAAYICREPRDEFFRHMDAANIDLKAFTERFYRKLCGARLAPILETLIYLKNETDVWLELTNLLIPGENDSEAEIEEMTCWIMENLGPDVPLHFTAFHPDWKMRSHPATPMTTLARSRNIALKNGLHHVYTGNVHDFHGLSSYCYRCGETLIGRDWYELSNWRLVLDGDQASCRNCHAPIAGVFDAQPGNWGPRRQPILIRTTPRCACPS
jgi:pyruvate formate lyase activating enzyme